MIDDKTSFSDMKIQSKVKNKLYSGSGRITVSLHGAKAVLSELSSTYPLKLLSPHIYDGTAIVYLLTYGGGLVGGDEVDLVVDVQRGARLVLLSQGTTKVFKSRLGRRLAYANTNESPSLIAHYPTNDGFSLTKQNSRFFVASESMLLLVPEPVTCFRDASYNQIQRFEITEGGSVVILDWITSGRLSRGEEWEFSRYYSVNDIWHNGKRIAKDVTLLDNHHHDDRVPDRPLQNKLQPYSCYAMLILYGPRVHSIIRELTSQYDKISILKSNVPSQMIWSISPIDSNGQGLVVRVGGVETETVKAWLKQALSGIEYIMGKDVYRRIFQ